MKVVKRRCSRIFRRLADQHGLDIRTVAVHDQCARHSLYNHQRVHNTCCSWPNGNESLGGTRPCWDEANLGFYWSWFRLFVNESHAQGSFFKTNGLTCVSWGEEASSSSSLKSRTLGKWLLLLFESPMKDFERDRREFKPEDFKHTPD